MGPQTTKKVGFGLYFDMMYWMKVWYAAGDMSVVCVRVCV